MIDTAINQFATDLMALPWVERYGGLTKLVQNGSDKANYPVSVNANYKDCFDNEVYTKMVPSDAAKSLLYWEQTGPVRFEERPVAKNSSTFQNVAIAPVRLMVYINLPKLGLDNTYPMHNFVSDVIRVLDTRKQASGWLYTPYISGLNDPNTTRKLFQAYGYNNVERLMYYPSLVFSINMTMECVGQFSCDDAVTELAPITCIDYAFAS